MANPAIAIFNDTRPVRHFGCEAVMAAIDANIGARGGRIIHSQPIGRPWRDDPQALEAIAAADLVLVNGEGTIHHNSRGAGMLSALGPYCAARGKRCFLVNATLQANEARIVSNLAAFDGIWVREGRSADEMARHGVKAELCGDLSFFHDLPRHHGAKGRGLVLDSADRRIDMAAIAAALRVAFVSMRYNKKGLKAYQKRLLRWQFESGKPSAIIAGINSFDQFAAFLAGRRFIVTGRFHGLCFAANCQVPFSAVPLSNWKNEAILEDIGLGAARRFEAGTVPKPFTSRELALLGSYKTKTRNAIEAMFDRIMGGGLERAARSRKRQS
jgi:hypothetical protein